MSMPQKPSQTTTELIVENDKKNSQIPECHDPNDPKPAQVYIKDSWTAPARSLDKRKKKKKIVIDEKRLCAGMMYDVCRMRLVHSVLDRH